MLFEPLLRSLAVAFNNPQQARATDLNPVVLFEIRRCSGVSLITTERDESPLDRYGPTTTTEAERLC